MIFRILKKDLQNKRTVNIILFLFVVLTTVFFASGVNNLMAIINGTDYYFDNAGIGDFVVILNSPNSDSQLRQVLDNEQAVISYKTEDLLFGTKNNITLDNKSDIELNNTVIFQALNTSVISYFDKNNEVIENVEEGHLYVTSNFLKNNNLKEGDTINITKDGVELSLIVDGVAKDALLGSNFMNNIRFLLSNEDMNVLLSNENISDAYKGEACYIETDNANKISSVVSEIPDINIAVSRDTIKMCYVIDVIVAFIVLLLSVAIMIVSFVILKFSITFTIMEEFREIGVMKAIGITSKKIRQLYIIKYFALAITGAVLGFFISIPFSEMLLKSASQNMVLGNDNGIILNVIGTVIVIFCIVLCSYLCSAKVKKVSVIEAIRFGQTGERYTKKRGYRIAKSHTNTSFYLALNDVLSSPKSFLTIIFSFFICMLFVLMVLNTKNTMKSDSLINQLATKSDLYMTDVDEVMEIAETHSKDELLKVLNQKEQEITNAGMPCKVGTEIQARYNVSFNENDYLIMCSQGINIDYNKYEYTKGVAPQSENEVAITQRVSEITGAKIGDTIVIDYETGAKSCIVTGYYETFNMLGEAIRLYKTAPAQFNNILPYQIDFTDNPTKEEIEQRKEKIKQMYNNDDVVDSTKYANDSLKVGDILDSVLYLLLAITIIVVVLIVILMERIFIADEKSQIALFKAIGFSDKAIIKWHIYRFAIISAISFCMASVLSVPMTKLCISPIFSMMGVSKVNYNIIPTQIFLIYPLFIFAVVIIVTTFTSLYTRTIKSTDTSNIE